MRQHEALKLHNGDEVMLRNFNCDQYDQQKWIAAKVCSNPKEIAGRVSITVISKNGKQEVDHTDIR